MTLSAELIPEFRKIFDNAVVNNSKRSRAIAMRVRIFFDGESVRCPARVPNADRSFERSRHESLLEGCDFSSRALDANAI